MSGVDEEGDVDRDFFLVDEAPRVFLGRPLGFFTGTELREGVAELEVRMASCFLSWPISEFNFLVRLVTWEVIRLSSRSLSTLVSVLRRVAVRAVASSLVSVEWNFFRVSSISMSVARVK